MIIFGHRFIQSKSFYHVFDIDSISNTPSASTIFLSFSEDNLDIINHARENDVEFALGTKNITQIIYASSLDATFIIVDKELAKTAQNIANEYLFDAKILVKIQEESEIEEMALLGVDGVIFVNAIIKTNS